MRESAPAKINLYLHVGARRADGYHDLESLVVFADIGDMLTFARVEELSLSIEGPFAGALGASTNASGHSPSNPPASWPGLSRPSMSSVWNVLRGRRFRMAGAGAGHDDIGVDRGETLRENLVLRAARALAQAHGIEAKARIVLTKNLPVASGIGGGSADAAAALRGLNTLWGLNAPRETLQRIGLSLGSDVPVCVASKPAYVSGRGEWLAPVTNIPALPMVLVNPAVPVSTAEVFGRLKYSPSPPQGERVGVRGFSIVRLGILFSG